MNPCMCGCGGETRSRFQPGHDARLKGRLVRTYREGGRDAEAAKVVLLDLGWGRYIGIDQPKVEHLPRERAPRIVTEEDLARKQAAIEARLQNLADMKAASKALQAAGRHGKAAGDRRLIVTKTNAQAILALTPRRLAKATQEDLDA